MSIQPDPSRSEEACAKCGAIGRKGADACWLCGATTNETEKEKEKEKENPFQPPEAHVQPPVDVKNMGGMTGFVLGTGYVLVSIAVLAILPGPGVLLLVFGAPALVRSWNIRKKREAHGVEVTPLQQLSLFIGSFLALSVSVVLVFVSAFGTFCAVCLTGASTDLASESTIVLVAFLAAALAGLMAVFASRKILGRQWRRQTFEDSTDA
jgi:hypothetical protein